MEWRGYVGEEAYRPPLACSEGNVLRITNVTRACCCGFRGNCKCPMRCTDECPSGAMRVYPTDCNLIRRCNGTTDCVTLVPSKTWKKCNKRKKHSVYYIIQICGTCVTGTIILLVMKAGKGFW